MVENRKKRNSSQYCAFNVLYPVTNDLEIRDCYSKESSDIAHIFCHITRVRGLGTAEGKERRHQLSKTRSVSNRRGTRQRLKIKDWNEDDCIFPKGDHSWGGCRTAAAVTVMKKFLLQGYCCCHLVDIMAYQPG